MEFLETPRLILRNYEERDWPDFRRLNSDPRVMEFFPAPWSESESREVFERLRGLIGERGWGLWALEEKESGKFVGWTGLHVPNFEASFLPGVEIGWRTLPEFWNQGLATEAATRALDFGFKVLRLPQIVSFTAVGNVRSQRIMEKIGMERKEDWDFLHPKVADGHVLRPHVVYVKFNDVSA